MVRVNAIIIDHWTNIKSTFPDKGISGGAIDMNIKYVLINYNYSIPFAFQLSTSIFIIVIITIYHDAEQRQSRVFGTAMQMFNCNTCPPHSHL